MWNKYYSVSTLQEATELLAHYRQRARIIAGGTDILIELHQHKRPDVDILIDITRVPNIDTIQLLDGQVVMGALVNHNHVVGSDIMRQHAPPLVQASWEVGAPQIRNRATIAGNLITASPANDTIVPLTALGASVTLASTNGERIVPLDEFYTGLRQTVMQPDEILTQIRFPAMTDNQRGMFIKLGLRRAQAISVVNTAVVLTFDGDTVANAAITLGSVAPTIINVPQAEAYLVGKTLTDDTIRQAARLAGQTPTPIDDVRSTAEYRSEMVKVIVARALRHIANNTHTDNIPEYPAMLWNDNQAQVNGTRLTTQATHQNTEPISATINGKPISVNAGHNKSLLHWLREDVGLKGTKEGCAEGECGACTILLDGNAVMSCMVAAPRAHNADIVTVEGLQKNDTLHPIQQAFIDNAAVQCGFCTPGFLMSGAKLLDEHPQPTQEQIEQSISGNLCRCTGYYKIIDAFIQATQQKE